MSVCKLTVAGLSAQAAITATLIILSVMTGAGLPFYLLAAAYGLTGLFFLELIYTRVLAPIPASISTLEPITQKDVRTVSGASQTEPDLEGLINALPVAVLDIDMDGKVTSANEAASALSGYHSSDMKGRPLSSFIAEECLDEACDLIQKALSDRVIDCMELRMVLKSGAVRSIRLNMVPIRDKDEITGCRCVAYDMTSSRESENALQEARRASEEASIRLEKAERDLEEFALIAIKREGKMREIRERLQSHESSFKH
ncbi:MAG: PAS domain-containing protein [Deltaproteobacteria bacterium]|mgnify:FL=1